ncbi:MAG: bifunctional DNA primase/polymerase, partial [Gemmataceae bacterium]|nr:bifunctional DNA primase/polymerase [Gemmataceae bacterium]
MSNKDVALGYAGLGWQVFPCHWASGGRCSCGRPDCDRVGKHPMTGSGFKDATSEPGQVGRWWDQWPDANIGVATGPDSGIFVLDLDGPEAVAELEHLEARHGELPATVMAHTGKGSHRYFRWDTDRPVKNRAKINGVGIDVRGEGGYVIAAPSMHQSGKRYEWLRSPGEAAVSDAPDWLVELVSGSGGRAAGRTNAGRVGDFGLDLRNAPGVLEGGRHDAAARLIGAELGRGHDPVDVLDWAYQWADRCDPPMGQEEVKKILTDLRDKDLRKLTEGIVPRDTKPDWPILGPDAFHGLAGEIVRAIEPNTEADRAAVLVQLLALFGNEVGRSPYFEVGPTRHHANLFVIVAGESSEAKKGTSLADAKAPFGNRLKPLMASGLSSGEGLIARVTDAVYKTEPIRNKSREVTGYQEVLETPAVEDKRLIVVETEFGSVLKVMERPGNTVSSLIRNAWDDGNLSTLTVVRRNATNAHISVIGHITVPELKALLGDTDLFNGFANRFLWAGAKASKRLSCPVPHDLSGYDLRLEEAVMAAQTFTRVTRDTDAQRLWDDLYHGELGQAHPGLLDTIAGRAEPQVIRLSLVYALLDKSPVIRVEHVRAAMAVWRYCLGSARVIFGGAAGNPIDDTILAAVQAGPLKTADIHRLFNNHQSAGSIRASLQRLMERGSIRKEREQSGGRPAEVWMLVGYQDETWWGRLALPAVYAWTTDDRPLRLVEQTVPKGDAGPKALSCYGLLRADTGRMMLRFVTGRPVSQVTEDYLAWVCKRLGEEGRKALLLVWDNAAWHLSKRVRAWIKACRVEDIRSTAGCCRPAPAGRLPRPG